jgi:hypothetical protein
MYEPGLFDIVEALSVLSSTFCGPVAPAWASPSPVRGPATGLQPYIYEAMRSFSVAAETIPMWLHFLDDHTADVAFLMGPATLSTPSFQAEGDTVEVKLGVDSISDSAQIFSGRMFREDHGWSVARETVLQVLERFDISPPPDS